MKNIGSLIRQNRLYLGLLVLLLILGAILWAVTSKGELVLYLHDARTPFWNKFFSITTHLGDGYFITVIVLTLILVRFRLFLQVGLTCLLAGILVYIIKHGLFPDSFRPGPYFDSLGKPIDPVDGMGLLQRYSFPSGHAAGSVALFSALAFNIRSRGAQLLCLLAACIAMISRVYLGQHFLGDVVMGGTISLILAVLLYVWVHSNKLFNNPGWDQSLLTVWRGQRTG